VPTIWTGDFSADYLEAGRAEEAWAKDESLIESRQGDMLFGLRWADGVGCMDRDFAYRGGDVSSVVVVFVRRYGGNNLFYSISLGCEAGIAHGIHR
jgi:hypothetical protein